MTTAALLEEFVAPPPTPLGACPPWSLIPIHRVRAALFDLGCVNSFYSFWVAVNVAEFRGFFPITLPSGHVETLGEMFVLQGLYCCIDDPCVFTHEQLRHLLERLPWGTPLNKEAAPISDLVKAPEHSVWRFEVKPLPSYQQDRQAYEQGIEEKP